MEAVPYMIRSASGGGQGETQVQYALIIRPSSATQQTNGTRSALPGAATVVTVPTPTASKGASPQLISSFPSTIPAHAIPKVLVPTTVQVQVSNAQDLAKFNWTLPAAAKPSTSISQNGECRASSSSPFATCRESSPAFAYSPRLFSVSPSSSKSSNNKGRRMSQSGNLVVRVDERRDGVQPGGKDSTTPDSGIQSVPTSPSLLTKEVNGGENQEAGSLEEEPSDDFGDMPRLVPVHLDSRDEDEDGAATNGSECEQAAMPSISIVPTMKPHEVIEHLSTLFGPEELDVMTDAMKQKTKEKRKRSDSVHEAEERRTESREGREGRSDEEKRDGEDELRAFRAANRKRLLEEVERALMETINDLRTMSVDREKRKSTGEAFPTIDWRAVKRRRENEEKTRKKDDVKRNRSRKRTFQEDEQSSAPPKKERTVTPQPQREKEKDREREKRKIGSLKDALHEDFQEIDQNFITVRRDMKDEMEECGCREGGCASNDCANRLRLVECRSPECGQKECANRATIQMPVSPRVVAGVRDRRPRVRGSRKAGETLCEILGEIVTAAEMEKRLNGNGVVKAVCLPDGLVLDMTRKGAVIASLIPHSCSPNAKITCWRVNGSWRVMVEALEDLPSGCPVTVSFDGLLCRSQHCTCNSPSCTGVIRPSRPFFFAAASPSPSTEESRLVVDKRLFLLRNRRQNIQKTRREFESWKEAARKDGETWRTISRELRKVARRESPLNTLHRQVRSKYRTLLSVIESSSRDARRVEALEAASKRLADTIPGSKGTARLAQLRTRLLTTPPKTKRRRESRILAADHDLSYLDSEVLVGAYNPDEGWPSGRADDGSEDKVRCVCGALEDDDTMLQCDVCHFWLHIDCLPGVDENADFKCAFCEEGESAALTRDVVLSRQPEYRLPGCLYYKALVNARGLQIRLNETIYVQRMSNDEHKLVLKRLDNATKAAKKEEKAEMAGKEKEKDERWQCSASEFSRRDLRTMRVERLFELPSGERFLFGFYYARPHETFCDPSRLFHPQEVFATPLYDTLPLDAAVGRCVVLDVATWSRGRPSTPRLREEDVLICEFQIDRNQRSFERVPPKNQYRVNTAPYVFDAFSEPRSFKRSFTPFVLGASLITGEKAEELDKRIHSFLKKSGQNRIASLVECLRSRLPAVDTDKTEGDEEAILPHTHQSPVPSTSSY